MLHPDDILCNLLELLGCIDNLPSEESGVLVVGPARTLVLVENRKVCWIDDHALRGRLRDLILSNAERELEAFEWEAMVSQAAAERRPLGDVLVEHNFLAGEGWDAAMRQHVLEALLALCAADISARTLVWMPREKAYRARPSFPAAVLLDAAQTELGVSVADLITQTTRRFDMPSEKQIVAVLDKIAVDLPGFIAASLVDLESGMTLGVKAVRPDFDLTSASAYNSEMVKQKLKTIEVLGLKTNLEDMLITLGDQLHVIRMINESAFLYLCVDRSQTNLAIARNVVARHLTGLGQASA